MKIYTIQTDPARHYSRQPFCAFDRQDSVKRGAAVVQQLLTFARNEKARMELTDPNAVIGQLAVLLKETLPKTIELKLELRPALPPVLADANQLAQALLNLCLNARDAMPDGGNLTVKTELTQESSLTGYGESKRQPHVLVEVADTGLGIDDRIQSRIFDPFFTTKGIGEGSGLGLAVVYGIVRAHDGFITVESRAGKGSTFRMFLPSAGAVDLKLETKSAPAKLLEGRGRTVLVVEDEKDTVRLLQMELMQSGFEILTAFDGEAAVETYRRHQNRIDIVLLDLGVPKLHGREVLRTVKSECPQMKVIVMTGYLEDDVKLELAQLGVHAIVNKPFYIDQIRNALNLALQSS